MQRLEVSGAVRPIYGSLGVKRLSFTNCGLFLTRSFHPICATCPRSRNHSALMRFCSEFISPVTSPLPRLLLLPLCHVLHYFPSITSCYFSLPLPVLLPATSSVISPLSLPITPPANSRVTSFMLLPVTSLMPRPLSYPFCYFLLLSLCHFLLLPPATSSVSSLPFPVTSP